MHGRSRRRKFSGEKKNVPEWLAINGFSSYLASTFSTKDWRRPSTGLRSLPFCFVLRSSLPFGLGDQNGLLHRRFAFVAWLGCSSPITVTTTVYLTTSPDRTRFFCSNSTNTPPGGVLYQHEYCLPWDTVAVLLSSLCSATAQFSQLSSAQVFVLWRYLVRFPITVDATIGFSSGLTLVRILFLLWPVTLKAQSPYVTGQVWEWIVGIW